MCDFDNPSQPIPDPQRSQVWRIIATLLILAVIVLAILSLQGCEAPAGHGLNTEVTPTVVENTTPRERDLLERVDFLTVSLQDSLAAQITLDNERARIAREKDQLQADIRQKESEQQGLQDRANSAEQWRQDEEGRNGKLRRGILWTLGIVAGFAALLGIAGGVAVAWFTKKIMLGVSLGVAVVIGATILLLIVLNAGDDWVVMAIRVAIGGTVALALITAAGASALWLWGRAHGKEEERQEIDQMANEQAAGKRKAALAETDPVKAATMVIQANTLDHVGAHDQDPTKIEPGLSSMAVMHDAIAEVAASPVVAVVAVDPKTGVKP